MSAAAVRPELAALAGALSFTVFPDHFAKQAERWSLAWPGVVDWFEQMPRQSVKSRSPMVKLATFGDRRTSRESLRFDANVVDVTGVEGDYDGEAVTPDEARERLERHQIRAAIVTSFSHTPERPRWRVLCPLSRPVAPAERLRLAEALNGALGGILNGESFTLSQAYYIGGPLDGEYRVLVTFDDPDEGRCLDDLDALDELAHAGARRSAPAPSTGGASVLALHGSARDAIAEDRWGAGDRHAKITQAAARIVGMRHTRDEALAIVEGLVVRNCHPPFPRERWHEIAAAVDSALQKYTPGERDAEASTDAPTWPAPLALEAFADDVGEFVRAVAPHSEADPAALVVQFLAAIGNAVGRGPHFVTDGSRQHTNIWPLIVGDTSSGRKGTSLGQTLNVCRAADPVWTATRVKSGLSSGEGLIYNVRDGREARGKEAPDPGVADKRLLVAESEFAAVLSAIARQGNNLSATLRNAWDTGNLSTLTKNDPQHATDAHVTVIGHITPSELRRRLDSTEVSNGLLNRFMLVAVKRSKYLPEGGAPDDDDMAFLARLLDDALSWGHGVGRMTRDDDARALWADVYPSLVERPAGLLGAATSRAAAQVVRLSCIYALLGRSRVIRPAHLTSALAVWRYVEASTTLLLGRTLGDPIADAILGKLAEAPEGLTRTDLHRLASGHWTQRDLGDALERLAQSGTAFSAKKATKGRPSEVWRHAKYANEANKEGEA